MVQVITVAPAMGGWTVHHEVARDAVLFKSGAKAEAAARALGGDLAQKGEPAEIHIYLRDGSLAGRYLCPPPFRAIAGIV